MSATVLRAARWVAAVLPAVSTSGQAKVKASRIAPAAPEKPRPTCWPTVPGDTLDRGWDRRLVTGAIIPDRTIDLHGHNLASAHATLDAGLIGDPGGATASSWSARVTGRPPRRSYGCTPAARSGPRSSTGSRSRDMPAGIRRR
ncbi:Smr/MutS family protein [Sphingomonas sp. MMS24-JH45]